MKRGRLKGKQQAVTPLQSVLESTQGILTCRQCQATCGRKQAVQTGRQTWRCPACGGVLDALEWKPEKED